MMIKVFNKYFSLADDGRIVTKSVITLITFSLHGCNFFDEIYERKIKS